jgi:mRNA interferase MazF
MNRGDIVLARFPHTAGTPAKNRPVLVVQGDYYNQRISNVLLASVTSNLARKSDHAHYFIDVATPEGKKSGLKQDSLVSRLNWRCCPGATSVERSASFPPGRCKTSKNA